MNERVGDPVCSGSASDGLRLPGACLQHQALNTEPAPSLNFTALLLLLPLERQTAWGFCATSQRRNIPVSQKSLSLFSFFSELECEQAQHCQDA